MMDAYEDVNSFYPPPLLDFDATPATLHPSYDAHDPSLGLDLDSFRSSDPNNPTSLLRRQFTSPSNFDDVFSDTVSNLDQAFPSDQINSDAKTPPLDAEDLRLRFSSVDFHLPLLDYAYRTAPVSIDAQLNGMFFAGILDSPSLNVDEEDPTTKSVTCYRRNLFGITGTISIPRSLRYVSTDHGEQIPIVSTDVHLSASESMEGAPVKLISVPFKSANVSENDGTGDKEPATIPLDLMAGAEMDPSYATFSLNWKRLQFRSSTANNGRRKELQQHFILRITLRAILATGIQVTLCDISKGPVIVRGRSPRNFQSKGPTSGSISGRKPGMPRHASMEVNSNMGPIKSETDYNFDFNGMGLDSDAWGRRGNGHKGAMTALPADTFRINPDEFFAQSSPDISRYTSQPVPAPVNLSLVEDETKKISPAPPQDGQRQKAPRLGSIRRPPSFSLTTLQSGGNDEETDPLYEYFPLGLDDWQEPVDAVYRPHVVHHIALPSSSKDTTKSRSKRYFSDASPT